MNKKSQTLIIIVVVLLVAVGGLITYIFLKPDKLDFVCGDKFCDKNAGENIKNCQKDCSGIIPNLCGDGVCQLKEKTNPTLCPEDCEDEPITSSCGDEACNRDETCSSCPEDCDCPVASGESRFGASNGELDLKSEISELGEIYSRINIGSDAHGWKIIKNSQESINLCKSCCIEPNCISECGAGYIYYCEPENREEGIPGKDIADEFYANNYEILFSVSPSLYGENEPKNVQDLLSLDYPANVQVYKDFIEYLSQQYPNVKYWEVLNEADNPQFWGDTAENYARFFTLTSGEIKKYCSDCKVGISLVGPNPDNDWFNSITNICDTIDFLDLHQYHSETMDELKEFEDNDLTKWKTSCPSVEIISTETGIPSEPITFKGNTWELGTSETAQAQDSIKYLTMMFNAGYSKIYYYLFDLDFVPGVEDIFEHTGLLNEDNSKKISFGTYKTLIEKVDYFTDIEKLKDGQYKYSFADKEPVYVLWCDEEPCTLHSSIPTTNIRITNYQGNSQSEIILTESPIFVEEI